MGLIKPEFPQTAMSGLGEFKIEKTLDGAIRISITDRSCVLSPKDAIEAARAILRGCGMNVEFLHGLNPPRAGK